MRCGTVCEREGCICPPGIPNEEMSRIMARGYWTEEGRCSECDRRGCVCPPGEGMNRASGLDYREIQSIIRGRSNKANAYVTDGRYSVTCGLCGHNVQGTIPDTVAGVTAHMGEFSAANYILNVFNDHVCDRNARWVETSTPYVCGTAGCRDQSHHTPECWRIVEPALCKTCGHPNGVVGNGFCGCQELTGIARSAGDGVASVMRMLRNAHPNHVVEFRYLMDRQDYEVTVRCKKCHVRLEERFDELQIVRAQNAGILVAEAIEKLILRCHCHRGPEIEVAMDLLNQITKVAVLAWGDDVVTPMMKRFSLLELY